MDAPAPRYPADSAPRYPADSAPREVPADMLAVGVVTATHGIGGELKLKSFSGEAGHLVGLREGLFIRGGERKRLVIERVRAQVQGVLLKLAGLDTPETARRLVGWEMWVPRAQAAPLGSGEYYEADLCRCSLWLGEKEIGPVRSVWDGGPAQLLEVNGADGRTYLVPFTDHFVDAVDIARRRISLRGDEILR
jgi:16S rRNA processing protein RimM